MASVPRPRAKKPKDTKHFPGYSIVGNLPAGGSGAKLYLAKARSTGVTERVMPVLDSYFTDMSARIRRRAVNTRQQMCVW